MARKSGSAGLQGALLVWCSAALGILVSVLLCVLLQDVAPSGGGPAFALFPYDGELVAIGMVGGVVPLMVCAMVLGAWTGARGPGAAGVFRSPGYWLAVLAIGLFLTAFFTVSHTVYGGLGLPKLWAFWLVVAGGAVGVDYWWLRGRGLGVGAGLSECYVMGTLGVFVSDVMRTLSGLASAPGQAAVWGGGGFLDILFWFGIYVALPFLLFTCVLAILTAATRALARPVAP